MSKRNPYIPLGYPALIRSYKVELYRREIRYIKGSIAPYSIDSREYILGKKHIKSLEEKIVALGYSPGRRRGYG
jgi:hypothetical protein